MATRRNLLLGLAATLAGCGREKPFHAANITGTLPDLQFRMVRASDGTKVSAEDYRGRAVLLYFGYTHCPDVCPTTLAYLSDVLHQLGPDAEKVRVLFVTVDPDRDDLDLLKQFTQSFGAQVDGLRGSPAAIADLAQRYRISYSVQKTPQYTVTHASAVLVFNDQGAARLMITDVSKTAAVTEDVRRIANSE